MEHSYIVSFVVTKAIKGVKKDDVVTVYMMASSQAAIPPSYEVGEIYFVRANQEKEKLIHSCALGKE